MLDQKDDHDNRENSNYSNATSAAVKGHLIHSFILVVIRRTEKTCFNHEKFLKNRRTCHDLTRFKSKSITGEF